MEDHKRRPGRPMKQEAFGKEFLLANALNEFARNGYDGTSLRTIAHLSDVDVSLITHHFGSKLDLWKAVVDDLAGKIMSRSPFIDYKRPATRQELEAFARYVVDDFVDFNMSMPYHGMFISNESMFANERSAYLMEKLVTPSCKLFLPFIEDCIREGLVQQQEPVIFFLLLINSVSLFAAAPHHAGELLERVKPVDTLVSELKRSVLAVFFKITEPAQK
ncbi:TetR/AcrR family transcriptional regulator [Paenibacillus thalictri]|nr:TetR/AcrR family transcriptional regulator [Paenibacillus thalictri]